MADLSITVEDNQLVIRGKQADDGQRVYLKAQNTLCACDLAHPKLEPTGNRQGGVPRSKLSLEIGSALHRVIPLIRHERAS